MDLTSQRFFLLEYDRNADVMKEKKKIVIMSRKIPQKDFLQHTKRPEIRPRFPFCKISLDVRVIAGAQ
jgi:hypothetical protein